MAEYSGITIDIKNLSRAFYSARKSIRLGVMAALEKSGPKVLSDVKGKAPVFRRKLKPSLKYAVKYKTGEATLSIVSNKIYMIPREEGPHPDGTIEGNPNLVWVPTFSPFFSKTATIASAKQKARSQGYTSFFKPPGSKILLAKRRAKRGSTIGVGAEYAPVAIITPIVFQQGKPYIRPAFEENIPTIQDKIMKELSEIFNSKG